MLSPQSTSAVPALTRVQDACVQLNLLLASKAAGLSGHPEYLPDKALALT